MNDTIPPFSFPGCRHRESWYINPIQEAIYPRICGTLANRKIRDYTEPGMHEFSICRVIVDSVLDELKKFEPGRYRLIKVGIVAGACHQIVPDALETAYEVLSAGTPAEGSVLDIRTQPVTARCGECGWSGQIDGFMYLCGACGSGNIEVTGGKELYLDKLEIEQDDET